MRDAEIRVGRYVGALEGVGAGEDEGDQPADEGDGDADPDPQVAPRSVAASLFSGLLLGCTLLFECPAARSSHGRAG
jgi:hypothetical protein